MGLKDKDEIFFKGAEIPKEEQQTSRTTERQKNRTTEKQSGRITDKEIKTSFYIDKEQDLKLDELVIQFKKRGIRKSKSRLMREGIELVLKKYKE